MPDIITVKMLIELLQHQDPNAEVMLSADEEGNGFSLLAGYSVNRYSDATEELYEENEADGRGYPKVVVLWPSR